MQKIIRSLLLRAFEATGYTAAREKELAAKAAQTQAWAAAREKEIATNAAVAEYFRHRPEALLTVNLADADAAERIMTFLGMPYDGRAMPHLNRTT